MRTTLTIDDDVAAQLERLLKTRETTFRELINDALRRGLKQMTTPVRPRGRHRTKVVNLGRCLVGSLDNVADVLAVAEGESYK